MVVSFEELAVLLNRYPWNNKMNVNQVRSKFPYSSSLQQRRLSKVIIYLQQESPPAWTQEAYRPPIAKYMLCCSSWEYPPLLLTGGLGGDPDLGWGYPPTGTGWGTPIRTRWGYSHPHWKGWGYPLSGRWGTPCQEGWEYGTRYHPPPPFECGW